MELRQQFVNLAECGHFTISEPCEQFSISRKTGHKWIGRYRDHGKTGLKVRTSLPPAHAEIAKKGQATAALPPSDPGRCAVTAPPGASEASKRSS